MHESTPLQTPSAHAARGCHSGLLYRKQRSGRRLCPLSVAPPSSLEFLTDIHSGGSSSGQPIGPRTNESQTSTAVWRLVGPRLDTGSSTSPQKTVHTSTSSHLSTCAYNHSFTHRLQSLSCPSFHPSPSSPLSIHLLG